MTTEIYDEANLKSVATLLHDARFIADGISFDKLKQTFSLKCWIPEPKRNNQTTSWKAYRLSFTNVIGCQINIKEKVRYYEISTLRFMPLKQTMHVIAHYAVDIGFQISALNGVLLDISETRENWD